jgi:hypothetical protein
MKKTETMFALVDEWKKSGKTQKVFCQEMDLKVGTFAYWVAKKRRAEDTPAGGFARIDVTGEANRQVEILYPNGVKLSTDQWDLNLICQLIKLY